ncbi:bifunctional metallophosphatase/5'-nucleotidase [Alkalibacillus almallahensis]|uniref:bifunctional metallophosphatase/5'-nucleotidase n=1 Tax=Alkalibacillus almallahensis TaxID=1379154 RepID=UPI001420D6C2|nr:bifunctional UDP-sugar hydrolase/5'-nucleotidase [Alkalibacillus almallahensis]NIK12191.1 2',3'-cyclic-nucleotide 2'-phosphodiesterase (5'-nucleotidase family) [Alkalibacillus almallahensis]
MQEQIHIYFTSDLHSYFDNWPNIMAGIKKYRGIHELEGETSLLLDNGDHLDRVHPITEATLGQSNVSLLSEAGYDVVTFGNNEGITLSNDRLYYLYDDASFAVACANVHPQNREAPEWLKPYQIINSKQGAKVGILGVTAPFRKFYELLGWSVDDPKMILEHYIPELRHQCDIVVVLSHLGLYEDEKMAEQYPIDVIIGGHTHHLIDQGRVEHGTIINAVGKQGYHYGYINIAFDHQMGQVTSLAGEAIPISDTQDEDTIQQIQAWNDQAHQYLDQVVTSLSEPFPIDWFQSTKLMERFVEELRNWTNADVAALNSGVLLSGFESGPVTKKHIHESCPHPMNPCKMTLTGQELIETVRLFESDRFKNHELKGLGFRGEILGKMVYSQVTLHYRADGQLLETISIAGERVDPDKKYTLATADTFSFPWLIPSISEVDDKQYYMPEFLRDVLTKCLSNV